MSRPIRTITWLLAGSLLGSMVLAESLPELRDPLDPRSGPAVESACGYRLFDCLYSAGEKERERRRQIEIYREAVAKHGRNHLPNSLSRLHLAIINHLDQLPVPTPAESIDDCRASLQCDWRATPNKCQHGWKKIQENARRRTREARTVLRDMQGS